MANRLNRVTRWLLGAYIISFAYALMLDDAITTLSRRLEAVTAAQRASDARIATLEVQNRRQPAKHATAAHSVWRGAARKSTAWELTQLPWRKDK